MDKTKFTLGKFCFPVFLPPTLTKHKILENLIVSFFKRRYAIVLHSSVPTPHYIQNIVKEIHENRIPNRVQLSWTRRAEAYLHSKCWQSF
jgi:hypothetical protein